MEIPESESSESEILGNDTTQPETLEIVESGQYTSARLEDSLSRIFLAYDSVNKLLVCTKCPILLNDNFVEHAMKIHGKVPHPELIEAIRTCLPISEFQVTLGFPIPAIPHLPIVQGFQCLSCQWCCAKKKSMTEHYKTHANNSYVELSLQSTSRGCCITFFPVVPPLSMPQIEETSFEVSRIVDAVSAVARAPSLIPENDKTRNILYTMAGWFTNETEFDNLKTLDIHSYFECPVEFTESKPFVEKYFNDALHSVCRWDVTHRMDLGRLETNKPLLPLKTEEARKKYAGYWSGLVFFVLNVCTNGLSSYLTPSDSIRTVCCRLLLDFSESSLLELLCLLTHEKITGVQQTENLLPLYLRLTSLRKTFRSKPQK